MKNKIVLDTYMQPVISSPFSSIRELMETAEKMVGERIAYQFPLKDGAIRSVSYHEFYRDCVALGTALTNRGFGNSHIAALGENSYPWITAYLSVMMTAGVYVPLDRELPADNLLSLLNRSESRVLFYAGSFEPMLRENRAALPNIELFIGFDREESEGEFLSYRQLLQEGQSGNSDAFLSCRNQPEDTKLLVFTSGTTGVAKGVMLTEHNLVSCVYYGLQISQIHGVGLSVLPYHHTYEAVCDILVSIRCGNTLFINDNLRKVVANMQICHPDYICLVPMFSEVFYNNIWKNIRKQKKEKIFSFLIRLSNGLRKIGIDLRYVFFKKIHETFGGHLRKIVCGGAPIRQDIGEFFDAIGMPLFGGYGITECSPLVSVNTENSLRYDTAGHHLPCLEWKIDNPSEDGIGEICVRGDVVMKGYYKDPVKTAEVLTADGWFHTGDYGCLTEDDQIRITGRKKNIIVLKNGKNIYPEEIENYVNQVPYIVESVVRGIKNEYGEEEALLAEVYLSEPKEESRVLADIRAALHELPAYKNIAKVKIRDREFEKTTTKKIRRGA